MFVGGMDVQAALAGRLVLGIAIRDCASKSEVMADPCRPADAKCVMTEASLHLRGDVSLAVVGHHRSEHRAAPAGAAVHAAVAPQAGSHCQHAAVAEVF